MTEQNLTTMLAEHIREQFEQISKHNASEPKWRSPSEHKFHLSRPTENFSYLTVFVYLHKEPHLSIYHFKKCEPNGGFRSIIKNENSTHKIDLNDPNYLEKLQNFIKAVTQPHEICETPPQ